MRRMEKAGGFLRLGASLILCVLLACVYGGAAHPARASTLDNLMRVLLEEDAKAIYNTALNAPFSKGSSGVAEEIQTETGALTFTQNLLTLSGQGLDLSLSIRYDSKLARLYEETTLAGNVSATNGAMAYYNVFDAAGHLISQRDKYGNTITYTWTDHALTRVTDTMGRNVDIVYGDASISITSGAGTIRLQKKTIAGHTGKYMLGKVTNALGQDVTFDYEVKQADFNLLGGTNAALGQNTVLNDKLGCLTTESLPDGAARRQRFDDEKNTLETVDATDRRLLYRYDTLGRLTEVSSPDTGVLLRRVYDAYGRLLSEEDGEGNITNYTYDTSDRLTSLRTLDRVGKPAEEIHLAYVHVLREGVPCVQVQLTRHGALQTLTEEYVYDRFKRIVACTRYFPEGPKEETYAYDNQGNLVGTTRFDGLRTSSSYNIQGKPLAEVNAARDVTKYEYDALGRLVAHIAQDGAETSLVYDELDRLIRERKPFVNGQTSETRYEYDGAGNITRIVDPEGYATDYAYNERNQLVSVTMPPTQGRPDMVLYSYDAEGRLLRTLRDGAITRYEYDELGQLAARVDPLGGRETYRYDLAGRATVFTDREGVAHQTTYDAAGRAVEERNDKEGDKTALRLRYDTNGLLLEARQGAKAHTYAYDVAGRLTEQRTDKGTVKAYTYDAQSRISSLLVRQGGVTLTELTYVYDPAGRLIQLSDGATRVRSTYDAAGRVVREVNEPTGLTAHYVYNPSGALRAKRYERGGAEIARWEYTYDRCGNLQTEVENGTKTTSYQYDAKSRLTRAALPDGELLHYAYDGRDNIVSKARIGAGTVEETTYRYDANDRLLSESNRWRTYETVSRYAYDKNGALIEKYRAEKEKGATILWETHRYAYDAAGRLSRFEDAEGLVAEYAYSPDGLRTSKTVRGKTTRFVYDANQKIIVETDGGYAPQASNLQGSTVYARQTGPNVYAYLTNGHGDVAGIVDETGDVLETSSYEPFGREVETALPVFGGDILTALRRAEAGAIDNPFGYCGEYFDEETGFVYLRARQYDPGIGRFVSEDSVRQVGFAMQNGQVVVDPVSLNLYAYGKNNPLLYNDPNGHVALLIPVVEGIEKVVEAIVISGAVVIVGGATIDAIGDSLHNSPSFSPRAIPEAPSRTTHPSAASGPATSKGDLNKGKSNAKVSGGSTPADPNGGKGSKPSLKKLDGKELKEFLKENGFEDEHAFKKDVMNTEKNTTKFDIKADSKTGRIYLEGIKNGVQIATDFFK